MAFIPSRRPKLGKPNIVNQKFQNIRGVDFRSITCKNNRSPDMQNMYRDWFSDGDCIQMFPGFRAIADFNFTDSAPSGNNVVRGIHFFEYKDNYNKKIKKVYIHHGRKFFEWTNFDECNKPENWETPIAPNFLEIYSNMDYENNSKSVVFNNKLYMVDGAYFYVCDGTSFGLVQQSSDVYIPTTYINRTSLGGGSRYEQRNMLTSKFKNLARGDGNSKTFHLSEKNLDFVEDVFINGVLTTAYTVNLVDGTVTFTNAPPGPAMPGVDNIEFIAARWMQDQYEKIGWNREIIIFDNRIFLTGHPGEHNKIRWSDENSPGYFGELNSVTDGNSASPIMNLIKVGNNTLCAIKADTEQDGMIYYHSPLDMNDTFLNIQYPGKVGIAGVGSSSRYAANSLNDDTIFYTKDGVKAIGKTDVSMERSIQHRSSFVDRKMKNEPDKHKAKACIWRGYYCLLFPSGNLYLADSRMRSEVQDSQSIEYEWFYITNIGYYTGQEKENIVTDLGKILEQAVLNGDVIVIDLQASHRPVYAYVWPEVAERYYRGEISDSEIQSYQVGLHIEMRGGEFSAADCIFSYDDNLYFATRDNNNGHILICKINADIVKNPDNGELRVYAFNNCGRKIDAYYCTPFYDYGAFNVLKRFEKKGNVLWTKSFRSGWVRLSVRTNRSFWNQHKQQNTGYFDYSDFDYADMTYNTFDQVSIVFRKLKERKWQLAQLKIENSRINSAFGIYELNIRVRMLSMVKK